MKFHDFKIEKYEVSNDGKTINFSLVNPHNSETSKITFTEVTLYNFIHTGGAIITDILKIRPSQLVKENSSAIENWKNLYGMDSWKNGEIKSYGSTLESEGYDGWKIQSALGFYGFVIAKYISDA